MAHIILTGATGTAGAGILSHALLSPLISHIHILSRRSVKLAESESKATVILHADFEIYPHEVLSQLKGATACIWAQGISSRGMSEEEYTKITVDRPLTAARAFAGLGEKFNFIYISGEGVEMDKGGGLLYSRVKGKAERQLLDLQKELPSLRVYNLRPGGIIPEGKFLAERKPTLTDRGINALGWVFEKGYKSMVISTENLGIACVGLAAGNGEPLPDGKGVEEGGRLVRNVALRALAEKGAREGLQSREPYKRIIEGSRKPAPQSRTAKSKHGSPCQLEPLSTFVAPAVPSPLLVCSSCHLRCCASNSSSSSSAISTSPRLPRRVTAAAGSSGNAPACRASSSQCFLSSSSKSSLRSIHLSCTSRISILP